MKIKGTTALDQKFLNASFNSEPNYLKTLALCTRLRGDTLGLLAQVIEASKLIMQISKAISCSFRHGWTLEMAILQPITKSYASQSKNIYHKDNIDKVDPNAP